MKNTFWFKSLRLWVEGLLLLSLRWGQLKSGFDPVTGLSRQNLPGTLLAVLIVLLAVAEAVLCFRLPGGKRTYLNRLAPFGQRCLPFLVAGSFLVAVGAVLLSGGGALAIAAAVTGAATTVGLLLFAACVRRGSTPRAFQLLPAMLFSVLFLLAIYLPEECNPVLASYYPAVLAASLIACSFYQLSGLTLREGKLRWFVFFGDLAVPLCLAVLLDGDGGLGRPAVFLGCALVLTVFLQLRRDEVLPEPEPEEGEDGPREGTAQAAQE